jgi:hypothetical protein
MIPEVEIVSPAHSLTQLTPTKDGVPELANHLDKTEHLSTESVMIKTSCPKCDHHYEIDITAELGILYTLKCIHNMPTLPFI